MRTPFVLLAVAGCTIAAHADIVDFEGLAHGEVVTNQYANLGLLIDVVNFNKPFNAGVVFNSNLTGTADPDLEAGNRFGGNLPGSTGNILIIQENDLGLETGFATDPDDEGGRPGGTITLTFRQSLTSFGFDVMDLDDLSLEATSVQFFDGDAVVASYDFASFTTARDVVYGDGTANRIDPLGAEGTFNRVVFNVGGSMGFDNFNFTVVPSPSTIAMTLAGAGLCVIRPRRRRRTT